MALLEIGITDFFPPDSRLVDDWADGLELKLPFFFWEMYKITTISFQGKFGI